MYLLNPILSIQPQGICMEIATATAVLSDQYIGLFLC